MEVLSSFYYLRTCYLSALLRSLLILNVCGLIIEENILVFPFPNKLMNVAMRLDQTPANSHGHTRKQLSIGNFKVRIVAEFCKC